MYSIFHLAKKYLRYLLRAKNGNGHGVHSPFVFDFIKFVLNDKRDYQIYKDAEAVRRKLLRDKTFIDVVDFGAGSGIVKTKLRQISRIAATSLKPKKFGRLLFRMVQYYEAKNVLELGTSLGITTAYMAAAKQSPEVTTMEGSEEIAAVAQQNFGTLDADNIQIITGDFARTLPAFLQNTSIDFAFIDGNHRKEPTLQYFQHILSSSHNDSILVFDDIHWSKEMEEAWELIKSHAAVTLTIDLFFIGVVFLKKEFKVKQHFIIRF